MYGDLKEKTSKKPWLIVLGIIFLLALLVGGVYNNLVVKNEVVNSRWAQVDTQLARRYDLIPNLVETVKGISSQEQEVFTALADARARYSGAGSAETKVSAANEIETSLSRLLVVVENYPVLRSSESYQNLMVQLEGSENRIAVARKDYNDSVQVLNTALKRFPTNILAGIFSFDERTYFEATDETRENPQVDFSN